MTTPGDSRVSIGRGALFTFAMRALALGGGFLTSIMTARALGAAGKGELALLVQIPALVVTLLSFGLGTANAYYVGRRLRSVSEAIADSLAVVAAAAIVGVPATVVVGVLIPGLNEVPVNVLLLASVAMPLSLATLTLTGILTGLGRVEVLAFRRSAATIAGLALVAGAFFLGILRVESALLITLTASAVTTILLIAAVWPEWRATAARPSIDRVREAAAYAGKAYVGGIAGFMDKRQDILLLGVLGTTAGVGVYSIGVTFSELLWQLSGSLSVSLMARSLQENAHEGAIVAARTARILLALMLASALAIGLFVWLLVPILYGDAFAEAITVFALLAPGVIVYGVGSVLWNYMMTHERLFPRLAIGVAVLNLVGNLVLIPILGIKGAALASTVSYSTGGIALTAAFVRSTGISVRDTLIARRADLASVGAIVARTLTPGTSASALRVTFVGFDRFWPDILAEGLNTRFPGQLSCRVAVQGDGLASIPRYLHALQTSDIVVRVGASFNLSSRLDRLFFARRRRSICVLYWIGSDVWRILQAHSAGSLTPDALAAVNSIVNIAGAQHLTDELTQVGIRATTVWFPGGKLSPPETTRPLPESFRVLTYLPAPTTERAEFYGIPEILAAASALPDVEFAIMGVDTLPLDAPKNVLPLGRVEHPEEEYGLSSVVVRYVEHDAVGGTVIEGLMHARHVIYSYELPHTLRVPFGDADALIATLARLKAEHDAGILRPNDAGRAWVLEQYDPDVRFSHVRDALLRIAGRS